MSIPEMVSTCAALKINTMSWQPSASLPALQQRALLYQKIREFFAQRQVLEVDVPVLSEHATVDPFIESLIVSNNLPESGMLTTQYLQTSPEFFLKRLLAVYQQDIYYLGKAFRQGERGARHNPEFTMLEWYRVGWDEHALMDEVRQLLALFLPNLSWQCLSYRELFQQHLLLDPHTASVAELKACAQQHIDSHFDAEDKHSWLDLLFSHCVEPQLPPGFLSVNDYPACQVALAQLDIDEQGQWVAKRFELYLNGLEIANGYRELSDAREQERRFKLDQQYRQKNGLPARPYDENLVNALKHGAFPECSGVALGIDRLLMAIMQVTNISHVLSFHR
ncbi:MAG: lysyl-tRNA synthetase class 2 [Candidatus Endobugula sp.]